jgi:hypothetical protein
MLQFSHRENRMRLVSFCIMVTVSAVICFAGGGSEKRRTAAAVSAAEAWLAVVDDGQYEKSWTRTGFLFQQQITAEKWNDVLGRSRTPFGRVLKRTLKKAKYSTELPGVPDGKYVVVVFRVRYQKKKKAHETVTVNFENGAWKVIGYNIR